MHQRGLRGERQTNDRLLLENHPLERCADFLRRASHGQRRDAQQGLTFLHLLAELGQQFGHASGERCGDPRMAFRREDKDRGHLQHRRHLGDLRFHRLKLQIRRLRRGQHDRTIHRRAAGSRFDRMVVARPGPQGHGRDGQ